MDPTSRYMLDRCGALALFAFGEADQRLDSLWSACEQSLASRSSNPPIDGMSLFLVKRVFAQLIAIERYADGLLGEGELVLKELRNCFEKIDKLRETNDVPGPGIWRRLERLQEEAWVVGMLLVEFETVTREIATSGENWRVPEEVLGRMQSDWKALEKRRAGVLEGLRMLILVEGELSPDLGLRGGKSGKESFQEPADDKPPYPWLEPVYEVGGTESSEPGRRRKLHPVLMAPWRKAAGLAADGNEVWPTIRTSLLFDPDAASDPHMLWISNPLKDLMKRAVARCTRLKWLWERSVEWRECSGWMDRGTDIQIGLRANPALLYALWVEIELRDALKRLRIPKAVSILAQVQKMENPTETHQKYYDEKHAQHEWKLDPVEGKEAALWPHIRVGQIKNGTWTNLYSLMEPRNPMELRGLLAGARNFDHRVAANGRTAWIVSGIKLDAAFVRQVVAVPERKDYGWRIARHGGDCEVCFAALVPKAEAAGENQKNLEAIIQSCVAAS